MGRRRLSAIQPHGRAGIASQTQAVPCLANGDARRFFRKVIERACHGIAGAGTARRNYIAVNSSGACDEGLVRRQAVVVAFVYGLAYRRPKVAARTFLTKSKRADMPARGDRA